MTVGNFNWFLHTIYSVVLPHSKNLGKIRQKKNSNFDNDSDDSTDESD